MRFSFQDFVFLFLLDFVAKWFPTARLPISESSPLKELVSIYFVHKATGDEKGGDWIETELN